MYGMLTRALQSMVVSRHGPATWDRIRSRAGVVEEVFLSMEQYPDELTFRLVEAAGDVLEVPPRALLESFGEHWIAFIAEAGYGEILRAAGGSLEEVLGNLDQVHTRVQLGMPHLRPPSFRVNRNADGSLTLRYTSERRGLAPVVLGAVKGLARRLGEEVSVEHVAHDTGPQTHEEFRIVATASGRAGAADG